MNKNIKDYVRVAIVGNPNSGKSTIFNNLTGGKQKIANYSGVTVDIKEGRAKYKNLDIIFYDLPGIYSLFSQSEDEIIARDFIIDQNVDLIINIIDASNMDRNLNLTIQLMELCLPMITVLNMSDIAKETGYDIDVKKLSELLGTPVVEAIGVKSYGNEAIFAEIDKFYHTAWVNKYPKIDYGQDIEVEIKSLIECLQLDKELTDIYTKRYIITKLLEDDESMLSHVASSGNTMFIKRSKERITSLLGEDSSVLISYARHGYINGIVKESVKKNMIDRINFSDQLDKVLANRVLGLPIFFGLMYLLFQLVFTVGDPFMGWIETGVGMLSDALDSSWNAEVLPLLKSLVINGIIGGVGGVIIFLPNIILLFFAISILEATGYMSRVAFIMDKIMRKFDMQGKSVIPMLIGFGCTVPAIMATRNLDSRRDRLITMLVAPLISCGARLPIYALIIPAFFAPDLRAIMLWLIYFIGILLAVVTAKILGSTIFKGKTRTFIIEMPPYRMPTLKGIFIHTWDKGYMYIQKAGTVILAISVIIWAMMTFPHLPETEVVKYNDERLVIIESSMSVEEQEVVLLDIDNMEAEAGLVYSVAGRIGKVIEPPISLLGFDWKIGTALIGAFAAKEVFVAQLGIVYSIGEAGEDSLTLREKLRENYTPLVAFCIMLFALISAPCMVTIVMTSKESGSWKYGIAQLVGLTILAYLITLIVYQTGTFIGW